ncbi:MAG: hypothetical protein HN909_03640 [Phycisphaerales bacterium]|nr:hypothetical protein [Phycisphaerales bacterium]MBT7170844.1 hypothetical protein [Phycisphaerales bacterium]
MKRRILPFFALLAMGLLAQCVAGCSEDAPEEPVDGAGKVMEIGDVLKGIPGDPAKQTTEQVTAIRKELARADYLLLSDPADTKALQAKVLAGRMLSGSYRAGKSLVTAGPLPLPVAVMSLAFSPDGKSAITTHKDSTARHWDLTTGKCTKTLSGVTEHPETSSLSIDKAYSLTEGKGNSVVLRDAKTGQHVRTFLGHRDTVTYATFSPDDRSILTVSKDGTIKQWWLGRDERWVVPAAADPFVPKTITARPPAASRPKATVTQPEEKAPSLAKVKLQGTLEGRNSTAQINGQRLREGDLVEGWVITKIGTGFVVLQWKDQTYRLHKDLSPSRYTPPRR